MAVLRGAHAPSALVVLLAVACGGDAVGRISTESFDAGEDAPSLPRDGAAAASGNGGAAAGGGLHGSSGTAAGGAHAAAGSTGLGGADASSPIDAARDCDSVDAAPTATISIFCGAVVTAACSALTLSACEASTSNTVERLSPCCRDPFRRLLECAILHGVRCASLSDDVLFPLECASVEDEWRLCAGVGDNCTENHGIFSDAGANCQIECDHYAAACFAKVPGTYACECTFGPHLGRSFSPRACDPTAVAAACK